MTGTPLRLRPGLRVLPRGGDALQVGLDPRWAVVLDGLDQAEVALWSRVDDTTDLAALAAAAPRAGVDAVRTRAAVAALHAAGLVRADPPRSRLVRGPTAADAAAWSVLRGDGEGEDVVAARARAVVGVVGLGPTGAGLSRLLAAAGVGTLLLDDDAPVRSVDVAAGAHRWSDVGTPRATALRRALRDAAPGVRVDGDADPDVVVVVERDAADPARAALLTSSGVPHLSVVVRATDALVGPCVRPGADPCLRCLDLHRTDADPAWPRLLAAATARPDSTAGGPAAPPGEVGVLAAACAALAAAQVLALLAGTVPLLCGATAELTVPDVVPRLRPWAPHPDCGCTQPPDVPGRPTTPGPAGTRHAGPGVEA
ncbi:ThiF family adenylyltransferase [Cellulomonas shaoxiangyii]|uniref:Thiamine biosynthesis protein ThiF n=1 Tax=Cellulomonas shaoxiangyii TaxID=2566013 RepID=A0A4P7SK01_9CELL|nr:ThiF family adenylyltransferase [Cellulomonas shaoxiangyii]QCB93044.1 thiamine biosynthesis protein ThiF [Cellulomonas shaoxiangyii]TGY84687.1 thiamine biosynthesis protein ThiF [Cellulomonas shaoxiangyii]